MSQLYIERGGHEKGREAAMNREKITMPHLGLWTVLSSLELQQAWRRAKSLLEKEAGDREVLTEVECEYQQA